MRYSKKFSFLTSWKVPPTDILMAGTGRLTDGGLSGGGFLYVAVMFVVFY